MIAIFGMRDNGQNAQVGTCIEAISFLTLFNKLNLVVLYSKSSFNILILDECGSESKKTRRILCKNEATLEIVDDYLCGDQRAKPAEEEACEGKPCKVAYTDSI